ncbi:putative nucleic acid-binding, replication factor A [Arabidopsis thaliana]
MYDRHIALDQWRVIENFSLGQVRGHFRVTDHQFKMSFISHTFVSPCVSIFDDPYMALPTFQSIIVDVLGQVVNVENIDNMIVNNKSARKLEFELRNEMCNDRLPCTLWGKFANQVSQACENSIGGIVVCLIRFAKISTFRGQNQITNAFDASVVIINPEYPEVEVFKNTLPKDGLALTIAETKPKLELSVRSDDYFEHYPKKSIACLLDFTEKCKIMCTIFKIDGDMGWFYVGCKKCSKKVELKNNDTSISVKPKELTFWCPKCNLNITQVFPRFKLHVGVMDHTGDIKCILFDGAATEMIGDTTFDLLDGVYDDDLQDPAKPPPFIKNLVGKTFQLLVCVENDNLSGSNDTYRIGKVWSGVANVKIEDPNDSEGTINPDHLISGSEAMYLLTNSSEGSKMSVSGMTTPSSKRTVEDTSLERCSTTKKTCLKPIKLEKLDGLTEIGKEEDEKEVGGK